MIRRIDTPAEVPLPLLITGVAGVPGYNAMAYFHAKYPGRVVGIRQADNFRLVGPGVVACNAEDREGLARLFEQHRVRRRARLRRQLRLKQCELAPEIAWRINVEGVQNLLSQTVPRGLRLVHLSCDLVFSGDDGRGGYVETDPTDPVTVYGNTMAVAEEIVSGRRPDRLHPADFAADGRQFQRPCRGDRLDRVAFQEIAARHALFRRNPHAHLHRLPQPPLRTDALATSSAASFTPAPGGG